MKAHILQPDGTIEKQDSRGKLDLTPDEFQEATEKAEALKKENTKIL